MNELNEARQTAPAAFTQQTHECRFPGCSTLTVQTYCAKHRPHGEWSIAADFKREQEAQQVSRSPEEQE